MTSLFLGLEAPSIILMAQPGAKILIASLGEEMASHESLKNEELQHSGSSEIEY